MKQTQGAIGFLISAYRGILQHARFAVLASALVAAGAFSAAAQAMTEVSPQSNSKAVTEDGETYYLLDSAVDPSSGLRFVSGGQEGVEFDIPVNTTFKTSSLTVDASELEVSGYSENAQDPSFSADSVSMINGGEITLYDDDGVQPAFTIGTANVGGGSSKEGSGLNFAAANSSITGDLSLSGIAGLSSMFSGSKLTIGGKVTMSGAETGFYVGEVYDAKDGSGIEGYTGGTVTVKGGFDTGTGTVMVVNGGALNLEGSGAIAKFGAGSTLLTVSGKYYGVHENGKIVLKDLATAQKTGAFLDKFGPSADQNTVMKDNGKISVTGGAGIEADYKVLLNSDHSALNAYIADGSISVGSGSYINLLNMDKVTLDAAKGIRTLPGLADGAKLGVELDQSGEISVAGFATEAQGVSDAGIVNLGTDSDELHTLTADTSSKTLAEQFKDASYDTSANTVKVAAVKLTAGDTLKAGAMKLSIATADGSALVSDKDGNTGSLELSGDATLSVSGSGALKNLAAAGTVNGGGSVAVSDSLTLNADTSILEGTTVSAGSTDLAGYTLFLDPAWSEGASVLTTGVSSGTDEDTLNGFLIAGQNSAFYIGDTENGSDEFKSEAKELNSETLTALGFIDKAITLGTVQK